MTTGRSTSARLLLVVLLFALAIASGGAEAQLSDPSASWRELNAAAVKAYREGRYDEGARLAEQALRLAQQAFGARHPDTLTSMSNLALLYQRQGRYGAAEPLFAEALLLRREVLSERHPSTLISMNNLAALYRIQGRYGAAEPLYSEALQLSREELGPRHPSTLISMNNLAALYQYQGRYGEAEPLFAEALQLRRKVLGERHPDTLISMSNLALLYQRQGRLGAAEPLYREALQLRREVLGLRHPDTLISMNNLAELYQRQGRYGAAEPLYRKALQLSREELGPRHPDTLIRMNNLAELYRLQGRYGEAEPLYSEALQLSREVLGPRHPSTLIVLNNLALLYQHQGREAESLFAEVLNLSREVLGPRHPDTLRHQLNGALNLAALGRDEMAVRQLAAMEPNLTAWLGSELHSSAAPGVRTHLVASQASYQDVTLNLALRPNVTPEATRTAALAVLRFKGLQAEEEAYLAQIVRRGADPKAQDLAREIAILRSRLATLFRSGGDAKQIKQLQHDLDASELALRRLSPDYQRHLQVRNVSLRDLQQVLPDRSALLEIRQYRPLAFAAPFTAGAPHWAGLLLTQGDIRVLDLGSAAQTPKQIAAILADIDGAVGRAAAQELHAQLFGRLSNELAGLDRLYLAPDGVLHLVPFDALLDTAGRRLAERLDIRRLETGRDLLHPHPDRPAKGLIALGGIDFGPSPEGLQSASAAVTSQAPDVVLAGAAAEAAAQQRAAATLRSGFGPLAASRGEIEAIGQKYRVSRYDEPVELWSGQQAGEARLKVLVRPPRVLHLATHGFYSAADSPHERPMLLAGVALAGANRALRNADEDGILYAIEAQGLNLEGTELVVLSACETARGQIDYADGVSGLVRAFRTAGVRYVLVALRSVNDRGASNFMQRFYHHWLNQARSDPATALRATRLESLAAPAPRDPTWAYFILIGG